MSQLKRSRAVPAATFAAVIALAMPFIMSVEGFRNDPYYDTVRKLTVCYGETNVPMRRYSKTECQVFLKQTLESKYEKTVAETTPEIFNHPLSAVAAISFTYNIGTSGYVKSRTAVLFNQGDFVGGCHAMMGWLKNPELRERRTKERNLCLKGLE